jgi:YD repeat-containing protein
VIADGTQDEITRQIFDAAGRMRYAVDAASYVTERRFDALGHETQRIRYADKFTVADNATVATMVTLLPSTLPASAVIEETHYDNAGRVFETVDGNTVVTRLLYDALGQVTDKIEALGRVEERRTHTVYDALGRLIEQTTAYGTPEAGTKRFLYDAFGNEIAYVDPRGVDLAERDTDWALAERLRLGYTVTDTSGIRAKRANELSATEQTSLRALYTTTQTFDRLGRKLSATDALGNTTQTLYDIFGNIVKAADPKGNTGYFYYEAMLRRPATTSRARQSRPSSTPTKSRARTTNRAVPSFWPRLRVHRRAGPTSSSIASRTKAPSRSTTRWGATPRSPTPRATAKPSSTTRKATSKSTPTKTARSPNTSRSPPKTAWATRFRL